MAKYLMGIDNGSTVTKVGIYDLNGTEITVDGSKTEMMMPLPGYYERDMNQIWQANVSAISEALKNANIGGEEIAAVAITGHGNGLHLIDERGEPAYNAIEGADSRASDFVEKWYNDGTFERVLPKTMQSLWAASTICLLAWMKKNKPEIIDKSRWMLFVKDYIRYKLTGEVFVEITDLSGSNAYNNRDRKYDARLLKEFGVEDLIRIMPPVRNSADVCGCITKEAAGLTGLKEGTPVAGGMFDIDAAGIATGVTDESKMTVIAGTWCNNQYISKKPVISKDLFMTSIYSIPGYWLMLEGSATSASNLEWFVNEFLQEEAKIAKLKGTSVYEFCDRALENPSPSDANIIFVPFLYGSNAGLKAKAVFAGLEGWQKRAHVIRSIYEGIVFSHKTHIENLMKYKKKPEAARIAGGAARSHVWVQMFADILEISMEITGVSELGTLGAAICAGVSAGIFKDFEEAVRKMVKIIKRVDPDTSKKSVYEKKYAYYKKLISTLGSYWV